MKHLLILLVLFSTCAYGQTSVDQGILNNARSFVVNKKTDKAQKELDLVLPQISKASNEVKVDYYFLLGVLHYQKGDYQFAINELKNALTYLYKRKQVDCEAYLKIVYYLADSFIRTENLEEAESVINTALVRCTNTWEYCTYTKKLYHILEEICYKKNESAFIISQLKKEMSNLPDDSEVNLDINLIEETICHYDENVQIKGMPLEKYVLMIDSISKTQTMSGQLDLSIRTIDEAENELRENGLQDHPLSRILHINKAGQYFRIRDIEDAKKQVIITKAIYEKNDETSSIDYAQCLNNLSIIYQIEEKILYSTNLLYAVIGILNSNTSESKFLGAYLAAYDNLARNYYIMGDKDKALDIWNKTISIAEKEGIWDMAYSSACNYAYAMIETGDYKAGIDVLRKFMNHDFDFDLKNIGFENLLSLSYFHNDDRIVDILKDYIEFTKSYLTTILTTFSEKERDPIWSMRSLALEIITNAVCMKCSTPELCEMAYNTALYSKSLATRLPQYIADFVRNSASPEVHTIYNELTSNKKKIIKRSTSKDSIQIISDQISSLERKLYSNIKDHRDLFDDTKINCSEIKKRLGPKDVAIEFVLAPEWISFDSIFYNYGAIIERSSYESPVFIKLCSRDSLDLLIDGIDESSDYEYVNRIYDINDSKLNNLLIEPISQYLNSGDHIYYSPVGIIHKINLTAIPYNGKRMMDNYSISLVSSTSKLLNNQKDENYHSAVVVGGIDYNESIEDMVYYTHNNHSSTNLLAERSITRGTWDEIPGSLQESTYIDSLVRANSVSSTLLTHKNANEESIKALSGTSPDILHIATHGFFFSEASKSTSPLFSDIRSDMARKLPMQYCGLLFAGANNAWTGKTIPEDVEDGILNAEELSTLDFSNTKLAVLSACDTGLGKIDDTDGVYGLQRGFKLAGVETIIMSLWKIPDNETRLFMDGFYSNLMKGMGKTLAFSKAIERMRKSYPLPYYWASFIMLDGLN